MLQRMQCQRPYSIRTRIKTIGCGVKEIVWKVRDHIPLEQGLRPCVCYFVAPKVRQRPYSIRTRIKTSPKSAEDVAENEVRDHIPLEQGLRPPVSCHLVGGDLGQRPYSIRTRIKTHVDPSLIHTFGVRDHIPLEQGLRLVPGILLVIGHGVRDHIPLEQGLRLSTLGNLRQPYDPSETIFH